MHNTQQVNYQHPNIATIQQGDNKLSVQWDDGSTTDMLYIWLRDSHISNFHPTAQERTKLTSSLDINIKPNKCEFNPDSITITWQGEEDNPLKYSAEWLYQYGQTKRNRNYKRTLWQGDELHLAVIEYEDFCNNTQALYEWMLKVVEHGLALIINAPTDEAVLLSSTRSIGHIRETNFGETFKVISKPNPENVAYTSSALPLHTDLTYLEPTPNFQFLHCCANDSQGGLSTYVDAVKQALDFKQLYPQEFKILCEVEIPRRYSDKTRYCIRYSPTIVLNKDNSIKEICHSNHGAYIPDLDLETMEKFYDAYIKWARHIEKPEYVYQFRMEAGMIAVFDNRRVMHGRTEFDPNTGYRHLQGTYICETEFYSRLMVVERTLDGRNWENFVQQTN